MKEKISKEEILFEIREGIKEAIIDIFYVCPETFDKIIEEKIENQK